MLGVGLRPYETQRYEASLSVRGYRVKQLSTWSVSLINTRIGLWTDTDFVRTSSEYEVIAGGTE